MGNANLAVFDEDGHETVASIDRRMLGIYQVRLSEQEEWIARIWKKNLFQDFEQWPSKDHVDDDIPIRSAREVSDRVCAYLDIVLRSDTTDDTTQEEPEEQNSQAAQTCSPLYGAVPLSGMHEIRLIELMPGVKGNTIECRLRVDNMYKASFEALSYVWGTFDSQDPILVNGHSVIIRKNLFDALLNLRLPDASRLIWIDSVSINQTDLVEKASQVSLMGEIYRSAKGVIIFFGPGTESSDFMLDFVEKDPLYIKDAGYDIDSPEEIAIAFWIVSQSPWWRRYWVLQEYALPKDDPVLQFGRRKILASSFARHYRNMCAHWSAQYMKIRDRLDDALAFEKAIVRTHANLHTLMSRPNTTSFWSIRLTNGTLLARDVGEDRDRVYAIRELMGPVFKSAFEPNYTIPLGILYTRATAWLLTMEKFGDIWVYFAPLQCDNQPSWAVDLSRPLSSAPLFVGECATVKTRASRFHTWGGGFALYNNTLILDGLEFDEIHTVAEVDEEDISRLIKKLWQFNMVCSSVRRELPAAGSAVDSYSALYKSLETTFVSLACYGMAMDLLPYWLVWQLFVYGQSKADLPGEDLQLNMIVIQSKAKQNITWSDLLDMILCDFDRLRDFVEEWKQKYPALTEDFEEYLIHAVHIHTLWLGYSPDGCEDVAHQPFPSSHHVDSLEDLITKARALAFGVYEAVLVEAETARRRILESLNDKIQAYIQHSNSSIAHQHDTAVQLHNGDAFRSQTIDAKDVASQQGQSKNDRPSKPHPPDQVASNVALEDLVIRAREATFGICTFNPDSFKQSKQSLLAQLELTIKSRLQSSDAKRRAAEALKDPAVRTTYQSVRTAVEAHLMHATLFCTKRGVRGFGPCGTRGFREGDKVVLLDDVAVPMVLRRIDEKHHRIIGAAVVEGIMEGQALKLVDEGILEPAWFAIQ